MGCFRTNDGKVIKISPIPEKQIDGKVTLFKIIDEDNFTNNNHKQVTATFRVEKFSEENKDRLVFLYLWEFRDEISINDTLVAIFGHFHKLVVKGSARVSTCW